MTLLERTKTVFQEAYETMKKKNADYDSGKSEDGLGNFRLTSKLAGISMPQGIMVRLTDKMARLGNLLSNEAQVKNESLFDTIQDAINYLAILYFALESEKEDKT